MSLTPQMVLLLGLCWVVQLYVVLVQGTDNVDMWSLVYIPKSTVTNSSYNIMTIKAKIETVCASLTSLYKWPHAYCYDEATWNCLMFNYQTLPIYDSSGITDPVICKTHFTLLDCQKDFGLIVKNGVEWPYYCTNRKCYNGKIIDTVLPKFKIPASCDPPFDLVDGLGCLMFIMNDFKGCLLRLDCFNVGADLITLKEPYNMAALTAYRNSKGIDVKFWVGLEQKVLDGPWEWTLGGTLQSNDSIWYPGQPDENNPPHHCGVAAINAATNTLALMDENCNIGTSKFIALCQKPMEPVY